MFYNNGIVVQSTESESDFMVQEQFKEMPEFVRYQSYNGIGRYVSWPLEKERDLASKEITDIANNKWFLWFYNESEDKYALNVLPDISFSLKYLKLCDEKKIAVRILFCKTERQEPLWKTILPTMKPLGYDYATSGQGFYSAIPDDLLLDSIDPLLEKYRQLLNRNRLFDNESDIRSYIHQRDNLINVGDESIESFGDFCVFQLFEIEPLFFKQYT